MIRVYLCCLMSLLWLPGVQGQADGRSEDRLTLADGTQLRVDLQRSTPVELSRSVTFTRRDGSTETLSPREVTAFTFTKSGRSYRSVAVNFRAPADPRTPQIRFGEQLATGDVELVKVALATEEYDELAAGAEPYLYLLQAGDIELILRLSSILVYEQLHANPSRFRNLLKFLFRDCPRALALAGNARFSDADILRVLDAYAACDPDRVVHLDRSRLRGGVRLEHLARAFHLDIRDADFSDRQFSAGVGYQAVARFTEDYRRLFVLASVDFVYHSFRWEQTSDVSQSMIRGNLSLGYSVFDSQHLSAELTAGLSNYNAIASGFRSFFSNNYFLLNGGANLRSGRVILGIHYEYLPGQISRRPGSQLMTTLGYRIPL